MPYKPSFSPYVASRFFLILLQTKFPCHTTHRSLSDHRPPYWIESQLTSPLFRTDESILRFPPCASSPLFVFADLHYKLTRTNVLSRTVEIQTRVLSLGKMRCRREIYFIKRQILSMHLSIMEELHSYSPSPLKQTGSCDRSSHAPAPIVLQHRHQSFQRTGLLRGSFRIALRQCNLIYTGTAHPLLAVLYVHDNAAVPWTVHHVWTDSFTARCHAYSGQGYRSPLEDGTVSSKQEAGTTQITWFACVDS